MSKLQKQIEAVNEQTIQNAKLKKCDYCTRVAEYAIEPKEGFVTSYVCYMDKFLMLLADPHAIVFRLTKYPRSY